MVEIRLVRAAERVGEGVIVWIGGRDSADDAGGRVLIDSEGNGVVREYGRRVGRHCVVGHLLRALAGAELVGVAYGGLQVSSDVGIGRGIGFTARAADVGEAAGAGGVPGPGPGCAGSVSVGVAHRCCEGFGYCLEWLGLGRTVPASFRSFTLMVRFTIAVTLAESVAVTTTV